MPALNDIQQALAAIREQRDGTAEQTRKLGFRARELRSKLETARRTQTQGDEAAALARELSTVERQREEHRARTRLLDGNLHERAGELLQISIEDLVSQLDDHVPVLMFPVRLESKFAPQRTREGIALRVRIFPDDINVSSHDPELSASERASGATYWNERTRALGLDATERPKAEAGAWSLLSKRFGGPRARYIARTTQPAGWPAPSPPAAAAEPPRDALSGIPPRAHLLPDFFVVTALDAAGNVLARATGRNIPDQLQVGPDPEANTPSIQHDANGRVVTDDKLAWLIDYERAVEVGMAVTLTLPERMPVARLVALGMRFSLAPDAAASALEQLFSDHRYTRGIDVLPQGSPTNNTDGADSAFTTALSADEVLVEQEVKGRVAVAVLDHATKCDSQRLAEALGIRFEAIRDWPTADRMDGAHALAMNRALWPATIGAYLKEMIAARLPQATHAEIERFFLTYVCGRGLLPAIQVGKQPYGVLATSDLRRWVEESERGDAFASVLSGLDWFRTQFERLETAIAQLGRGDDLLAMTMRVVGQLAASAQFASRTAVTDEASWNTLRYQGTMPLIVTNWHTIARDRRDTSFAALDITTKNLPLSELLFFEDPDPIAGPIVDRDPEVPLSESEQISKFDNARNYINWLLSASTAELRSETFKDAEGEIIPPPKALLYRLLHHAWTANLVSASKGIAARLRPDAVATAVTYSSIVNVGEDKVVPDEYATDVNTAAVGLTQNKALLGDYVLDIARTGGGLAIDALPEALPLQTQREALARLAPLATAVLERLLAEHLDLASYRLDAWQTGVVARRLDRMRRRAQRDKGVYLAAYGYVENLVPKDPPTPVDQATIPASLHDAAPITEQVGNGGYVQAPSLTHGVTTAVLRNAYLTHTEPTLREAMSVNLTSRRVRAAMSFVEGIRAGQDLAALLGYQFERGLHERYPGIELDEFIYVLRARFPLVSRRLTAVPEGTAAEQIEARNVIDGYDMLEYVRGKSYPYALAGLPAAGSVGASAITGEIALLEDTLDSISDLMTAESVHQAVQSNIDRARGALASVTDGEMPPVPDVVQTPRSGRAITQRVALHLAAGGIGWANPLATPRALTNPALNAWLAAQLPSPDKIGVEVRPKVSAPVTMTLDQTGLDAIDVVLMCGDRIGAGSSELERAIAEHWRSTNGITDEIVTLYAAPEPGGPSEYFIVDASAGTAEVPLATLFPHLRSLRRMVSSARGLNAQDYRLPSEEKTFPAENPKGFALDGTDDLLALPARITAARNALATKNTALDVLMTTLKAPYEALLKDATTFNPLVWTNPLSTMRSLLREIALYGAPEALPRSSFGVSSGIALSLYEQSKAVVAAIAKRLETATQALAPLPAEAALPDPVDEARRKAGGLDRRLTNLLDAARQILGSAYTLQPVFRLTTAASAEVEARLAAPIETDALRIEGWLQSLARVRDRIGDLALACTAAQFVSNVEPRLVPVQLPLRAGDPWIGQAWTTAPALGDLMSVMTIDAPSALAGELEGLLLDDWTETIPTTHETTGIVFNFDRPNAAAPQALLLATPPRADGRWQWEELMGTVIDTFDRARLRAIEPDDIHTTELFPVLPMTLLPFTEMHGLATTYIHRDYLATTLQTG